MRRLLLGLAAVALVACGQTSDDGAAESLGGGGSTQAGEPRPVTDPDEPVSSQPDGATSSAMCVEVYSPETLPNREFAFDGTVTSIERFESADGSEVGGPDRVTFDVHAWYKGGEGATTTVQAYSWAQPTSLGEVGGDVGDRLLVSGDDDFAWSCGFTQDHSDSLAAEWEAALR